MLTESDFAYLAGVIDGEGSICFHQDKRDSRVWADMNVYNTSESLILWILIKFGGKLYVQKPRIKGRKQSFVVRWNGKESKGLIPRLLPYLIIKRDKAFLLMRLENISRGNKEEQNKLYQMARDKTGKELAQK